MLEVALLGQLRLTYDGKNVPFAARPKVAPLLAHLLLNCRRPIPRDRLAFALWPDEPEAAARANLRRHLHYLREILPRSRKPWVIADARTVCWNPAASVRVDVTDFEQFAANPAELENAVTHYNELLQGYDDEWVLATRERLRGSYVQSLFELARRARGRRDCASAGDYLGRILADDPWREDAVRALMAVRCEAGDRSSALQLCAEFEQRLNGEMGAALMPETTALRYAIERGNPLPAIPLTPAAHTATISSADLPFEGRLSELSQLRHVWESTVAGSSAFSLIIGEAGIGKTRLASEFALAVEAMGGRVFWGITSSPETVPYQAVTEVARAALGFVDSSHLSPYDLEVLARIIPELREGESAQDPGGAHDAAKLFDVIGNLFVELGRQRPALFILEDLHAAGPATLAMMEHIVRRCIETPILILATLREEEAQTADTLGRLRHLRGGPAPSVVPLAPLPESAVQAIVAQSLGSIANATRVAARAAGHPLFLAELLYAAADAPDQTIDELPTRLREMIDARSRRLSEAAAFLLRAASVVGSSFDLEVVAETVGWGESRLASTVDELIARRVLRQTPSARPFDYEFAHELIASATYESVPDRQRRNWHRRAGRAAEHLYASRLPELSAFVARHFELGGESDFAAAYYLRAAQRAASAFANDEALAYARRGLELKPSSPADRYELLGLTEEVLGLIGERAQQGSVLRKLERVARSLRDPERIREVLRRRESLHRYLGEHAAARRALARLHRLASGEARWEAIALRDTAALLFSCGSLSEAYETAVRAETRAVSANDAKMIVTTLTLEADVAASLGRQEEAKRCLRQAKGAADSTGSPLLSMRVLYCEMIVFVHFQAWSSVVESAPQLLELTGKVGSADIAADAHAMLGSALGSFFDVENARRHLHTAIEFYRACDPIGLFAAYNALASIELEVGNLQNAQRAFDVMMEVLTEQDGAYYRACARLIACELALQRIQFGAAIELAEEAIAAAMACSKELFEAEGLRCKGVALRQSGDVREAMLALERSLAIFQRLKLDASVRRVTGELVLAYALAGDPRSGRLADETLASTGSDSAAEGLSATLWALSQAFDAIGRDAEARETLVRAHRAFHARRRCLQSRADRAAFSRIPENAELARAYAAVVADSGRLDANEESLRVHRAPQTRTPARRRPREQSL